MIEYIEHHIVNHCNLNCKGCSHFSPLCTPWFESIEEFKNNFQKLSDLTRGQITVIRLMGGEPLLHPNISDFLIECRKLFPFSHIELVTNGLLLSKMDANFITICNKYQIFICLSNYGLIDINTILSPYKYCRYYNKQNNMYNLCLDLKGTQDNKKSFNNCEMHQLKCYYFQEDKIYPCAVIGNIHHFNNYFQDKLKFPLQTSNDDMYISINNATETDIKNFLATPRQFCKYCNNAYCKNTYHNFEISKKEMIEWITPI